MTIFKLKHGSTPPGNGKLEANELGWDTTNKNLYIGDSSGASTLIAGEKTAWWDNATSADAPVTYSIGLIAYPVGSIFMSENSTNPSTLFGGIWEQIKDVFLLSAGDTYNGGDNGGEATHTLTISEIPSHSHILQYCNTDGHVSGNKTEVRIANGEGTANTGATGGGMAHNNMPPYHVVYMWRRLS